MAFSYVQYTGDDSTTLFNVPFAYILKEHVKLYEDGVENAAFMWNSDTVISISPAPASGVTVRILRETPVDSPLVDYVDGTVLTEQSLDLNTQQMLFISQEAKDKADNSITPNTGGQWDGQSLRGEDFADPANLQDLATKHYVDTGMESEVAAAAASAASAASSATSASSHATDANTYRGEALSHKNAAAAAQTAAETAETNTASSETNAANSASAAATSATNAAGSATSAGTEASNAAASAAAAQTSKNGADTAKTGAQTAEANAASSATAAATSETNAAASAAAAAVSAAQLDYLPTFKNKIINPQFDVDQRGNGLTRLDSSGIQSVWIADRWVGVIWAADCSYQIQSPALDHDDFRNYLRMTVHDPVGIVATVKNYIEDVRTLAGKTCTVQFWARYVSAPASFYLEVKQSFGSGSGTSARAVQIPVTINTSSWGLYSYTFENPSVAGEDIRVGSVLSLEFSFLGGQSGTIDLTNVQLEEGNVATAFENRPIGLETSLCQRYYWKTRAYAQVYDDGTNGAPSSQKAVTAQLSFPNKMRVQPSAAIITEHSVSNGTAGVNATSEDGGYIYLTSDAANSGQKRKVDLTVEFDAEL